MCGIAGVLNGERLAADLIAALAHRGPDGIRTESLPGANLAHARLSIIDLEGGWQPLHAAGSVVVGNGEIYNYLELAQDHGLGPLLATGSDFEPLLHLYAREGPDAFRRLRGMYAFCLVGGDGRTWLVRDPFGIKPLYLLELDGAVIFASEPRAFLAAGLIDPVMDASAAEDLLGLSYTTGEATIFPALRRLAPGEILEVTPAGLIAHETRPCLPARSPRRATDEAALVDQLDAVLEESVRVHQRSDAPFGLFLSGGIDSAAIATLMARLAERPVTAFTCGFDLPGAADERGQAERVAQALDLDWREVRFDETEFWRLLPRVALALDDPTADYATLPTYRLAEAARDTLRVVLTGEGGDELFGGYGRYRRALRPALLGGRPADPRPDRPEVLARWREAGRAPRGLSTLQSAQWSDVATWLPNDLLIKLDRCLMANGLEGRTPFLDPEVADFAFTLPDRFKVRGRFGKYLLRTWLARTCPAAAPWARKQGFTVPVEAWIAPRAADIAPRVAAVSAVRRLRSPEAVAAAFAPGGKGAWPLLFLAVWSLIHLEGVEPADALEACTGRV
ncbi:asparagine synthase (glutamine-hydrolyzing) [Phenylobacterium sp.]|uniref:asparagine synthase (glutamine-hydrolyzing) n=2 Tax=Phenylobacterium sp. TaxID=1871053 RepID=UPI0025DEC02A|nr:asparagine synthase (glutamine-hydrolyzing) [Phenylobacterium sp.]MCA3724845.1 asparagine synthase (glutamine-hydrolyzing) [Phenylobacterium sp.]MCA6259988.1 asparagine synthase (glutamine-hydrolyzing) [Phenylobacterium sp.]